MSYDLNYLQANFHKRFSKCLAKKLNIQQGQKITSFLTLNVLELQAIVILQKFNETMIFNFNMIEMQPNLSKRWNALQYEWMISWKLVCPNKCSHIHDTTCTYEFFRKLGSVCKIGVKYYVFFHFLPLVLRVKKGKTRQEKIKAILRTLYEYAKSILFMGSLVSLTKAALCIKNSLSIPFNGSFTFSQSLLAGSSIFWEQRSRQRQIGYFVIAKALRSIYVMFKRIGQFNFNNQAKVMHIVLMGLLSYVFHHKPEILKYKETLEMIWGKD